jgi:hypothetical protein
MGARPTSARRFRGRGPPPFGETVTGGGCARPRLATVARDTKAFGTRGECSECHGAAVIRSRREPSSAEVCPIMINRVQALVLGFLLMAWISLVVILVAAPEVYERRLRSLPGAQRVVEIVFVVALTAFIVLLSIGVLRRWRWMFWLILIAFLFGVLRIPVAVLQISGQMRPDGPLWYVILQGVIGLVQVLIALAMIHGYRRAGVWGS